MVYKTIRSIEHVNNVYVYPSLDPKVISSGIFANTQILTGQTNK